MWNQPLNKLAKTGFYVAYEKIVLLENNSLFFPIPFSLFSSAQYRLMFSELSESLSMNDLLVYPVELKAKRGEQIFELSLRDSKILLLLAQNKGKVVDRDALFNYSWRRDYLPNSRTLDQHISKLRKLIDQYHKHPVIIKTVHGVSYRFDD